MPHDMQIDCPTFQLTLAEVNANLEDYVQKIEPVLLASGVAKIIPPQGWKARVTGYEELELLIPRTISQRVTGDTDVLRIVLIEERPLSLRHHFQ